ncbi:DgyrCDS2663 [Dimorphilus gyrociliatus]|uniref:DgyrCDS2663 n=1 Tax=Dimorphilus gyrociliatus TaxID=2664684 RepID=A0A7I8VC89_9ANNE|nr:DgyrCDS2663 [Dimorphilus gyrociliatus]
MNETPIVEAEFTKLTDLLPGAEGPIFTPQGRFFAVSPERMVDDQHAGQIVEINLANGEQSVICTPNVDGYGGVPAGCQIDQEGYLWVSDMRLGLLRIDINSKTFEQYCKTDKDGETMQGCNDLIFDYNGFLWITAPAGKIAPNPYERSIDKNDGSPFKFGSVYRLNTKSKEIIKFDEGLAFPNGIAVSHSSKGTPEFVIVAETGTKTLWSYEIQDNGNIGKRKEWGKVPGNHLGGPDGMDWDSDGKLLVANWGAGFIEVFNKEGILEKRLRLPFERVSNVHFKPDSSELYVTEHTNHAVWKTSWSCKGAKQFCDL